MAEIIKFPGSKIPPCVPSPPPKLLSESEESSPLILKIVWILTALMWPLLKWAFAADCTIQLLLAIYHWKNDAFHAGWTFALHFIAFSALTYFVGAYKPKGL